MASTQRSPAELDASKLRITLAQELKPIPPSNDVHFGQNITDHMAFASYDPIEGWSAPEIKPYGPLTLYPASSCFQYATSAFEGMKAYIGPDGEPRLFRPAKNLARFLRSASRLSLPLFAPDELLNIMKTLLRVERRWIPDQRGHSLYLRPMIIGTRHNSALLWIMCSPIGQYPSIGARPLSLLAVNDAVRAWPGGTGEYKISGNYGPTIGPMQVAHQQGYDQCLWLLGDRVTEAGVMNIFVVLKRDDDSVDLLTPSLDGTILPGITRESVLDLAAAHPSRTVLPGLSKSLHIYAGERDITMGGLQTWLAEECLLEVLVVGTAVVIQPVGRIGYKGVDLILPVYDGGLGPVGKALHQRITDIQYGVFEWDGWSVRC
ncbi:branched-chain amino acid aminotransferase II [Trametes coccinea BRFM310]|uniref:Branched-chain-amino-acid aminotransferase n=1 Tax=Trametes coccinea (strain BRFM310) TaxID=1353009 RepID=A0A1Y2IJQ4_TRAC3|nr:branched-chain amino acid aminotransferase II [Trametes coccinea BRFM310]